MKIWFCLRLGRTLYVKSWNFDKWNNSLKNEQIYSNLHWKGLIDSFFIANYSTILSFKDFFIFLNKFIEDNRVFNPEYILYSFISEKNLKIRLINEFDLALIRVEDSKPTKTVFIPFKDKAAEAFP